MRHQGTPVFMARAVVKGVRVHAEEVFQLHDLPALSTAALGVYTQYLPGRLEEFPQPVEDQKGYICQVRFSDPDAQTFQWTHTLRHDAESAVWLLIWWVIHIRAPTSIDPNTRMQDFPWSYLTSVNLVGNLDERHRFLSSMLAGMEWIDPYYEGLKPLFQRMARQIQGDLDWIDKAPETSEYMRKPDFTHECLQRIILDFLVDQDNATLLHSARHALFRRPPPADAPHASSQPASVKRSHDTMSETDAQVDQS